MIKLEPGKTVSLTHDVLSPAVYLDQAPLLNISKGHLDRFVSALHRRRGTLVFSWLNAVELADPEDPNTFGRAQDLFVQAFPSVAFQEAIPDLVADAEDADLGEFPISRPQLDRRFFEQYARWVADRKTLNPIDPQGFLEFFRAQRRKIQELWIGPCDRILKSLELARSVGYPKPDFSETARTPRPTRHLDKLAIHHLVNSNLPLTSQNVRDYHHMVVAVSYCDYVVLDKHWAEKAEQFQRELDRADLLTHRARVFRVGNLEGFLSAFEIDDYLLPAFSR